MFNSEFFPTPASIARKMVEPYIDSIRNGAMILDPFDIFGWLDSGLAIDKSIFRHEKQG